MNSSVCKSLSALLLVGCSAGPVSMQAGQWQSTTAFTTVEYAGAAASGPAGQAMREPQTRSECISAADAANPIMNLMEPGTRDRCRFVDSVFADGVIRVHGVCREDDGASATMNFEGTYTAAEMAMRVTMERRSTGTPGPQDYRLAGTVTSRRTGECAPAAAH